MTTFLTSASVSLVSEMIGMGVPSTLRGTIRELLTRACVGETWDPENSCGSFASPHWISSLGFPARPPAPLCAVAVDGAPWNAGEDGWILGGFSEAAFAAVCFTRRGVAEEEDLKLNAAAATTALRQVIPLCPCPERAFHLVELMSRCQAFHGELASLIAWLWRHPGRHRYAQELSRCCEVLCSGQVDAGGGLPKICGLILREEGHVQASHETCLCALDSALDRLCSTLDAGSLKEEPGTLCSAEALLLICKLPMSSITFKAAVSRFVGRRTENPARARRMLSALLAAAADPKVQGTRGAHSVMDLWQRSQPMGGAAGQVLGMLEVVGAGEAVEHASRRIEDWEGWGQGLGASKESIASCMPSERVAAAVHAGRESCAGLGPTEMGEARSSLRSHVVSCRGGRSGAVGLISFVICCHDGEGDADAVEGLGEIFQVLGRGRGGLARSAVIQALVVITALVSSGVIKDASRAQQSVWNAAHRVCGEGNRRSLFEMAKLALGTTM